MTSTRTMRHTIAGLLLIDPARADGWLRRRRGAQGTLPRQGPGAHGRAQLREGASRVPQRDPDRSEGRHCARARRRSGGEARQLLRSGADVPVGGRGRREERARAGSARPHARAGGIAGSRARGHRARARDDAGRRRTAHGACRREHAEGRSGRCTNGRRARRAARPRERRGGGRAGRVAAPGGRRT